MGVGIWSFDLIIEYILDPHPHSRTLVATLGAVYNRFIVCLTPTSEVTERISNKENTLVTSDVGESRHVELIGLWICWVSRVGISFN
jgi:hypothetical protein